MKNIHMVIRKKRYWVRKINIHFEVFFIIFIYTHVIIIITVIDLQTYI